MQLVYPMLEHKEQALSHRQEHFDNGETKIPGSAAFDEATNYETWLKQKENEQSNTRVLSFIFFAVISNKIVGMVHVRDIKNDFIGNLAGHIGYSVAPSQRRKGYATKMLSLALEKCKEMGIKKALVNCAKDNIISAKVIIKNGGVYENEISSHKFNNGEIYKRYWIDIK